MRPKRRISAGLSNYIKVLSTVRAYYPHSYREAQKLASEIYRSGADPESEIAIINAEREISRRRDNENNERVAEMEREMEGHTESLPIIPLTVRQARSSEVRRAGKKFTAINTSFQRLYGDRISALNPKTNTSIMVNVRVVDPSLDGKDVTMGPYNEEMPRLSRDDQYRFLLYTATQKHGYSPTIGRIYIPSRRDDHTDLERIELADVRMGAVSN